MALSTTTAAREGQVRYVSVGNAPIYVAETGSGSPALLLHGVPDSADLWQPVMAGIAGHYHCFAPDLPGFNRSALPGNFRFSLEGYGDFVNDLLDALGIGEPVTLVLHDWGGIFGMAFACRYPERVRRIVGGSFPFSHLYRWHPWARVWRTPLLGELSMGLVNRRLFGWEVGRGSQRLSREQMDAMYRNSRQAASRRTVLKLYRSLPPRKLLGWQSRLERLASRVPIDAVWGAKDPYVPTYNADLLHTRHKVIVPDCGHWVPAEAPEAIIECLLDASPEPEHEARQAS